MGLHGCGESEGSPVCRQGLPHTEPQPRSAWGHFNPSPAAHPVERGCAGSIQPRVPGAMQREGFCLSWSPGLGGCTLQGCSRAGGSWRWWGRREDAVLVRKVQPQSATSEGGTFAPCAPPRSLSPPGMGVPGRGSAVLFWRCPLYLGVISGARVSEPSGEQLPAVLWVSLLELGLDHMASRGAFQPQPFCSSGILWTWLFKNLWVPQFNYDLCKNNANKAVCLIL